MSKKEFTRREVEGAMRKLGVDPRDLHAERRCGTDGKCWPTTRAFPDGADYFGRAMQTELEHGRAGRDAGTDVTHDDAVKTAQIAAAHIRGVEAGEDPVDRKPFPSYYDALWAMEADHRRRANKMEKAGKDRARCPCKTTTTTRRPSRRRTKTTTAGRSTAKCS
jgi:hypothetical protein